MYDWISVHLLRKQGCIKDELQLCIVLHWQCADFHNGFEFQNCHSFRIVTHWEKQGYVMLNSKLSNTVIQQRRTLTLTADGDMMDKYQTVDIF